MFGNPNRRWLGVAVRDERYRYVEYDGGKMEAMLFDEAADPHELKNLAGDPAHKATLERLRKVLNDWVDASGDQGKELEPPELAKRNKRRNFRGLE